MQLYEHENETLMQRKESRCDERETYADTLFQPDHVTVGVFLSGKEKSLGVTNARPMRIRYFNQTM